MEDNKHNELKEEQLDQVAGGTSSGSTCKFCGKTLYSPTEIMVGVCFNCRDDLFPESAQGPQT